MSQEQLALLAEITPAYLGQVERGTKNVTAHTLDKICKALNITLSEYFDTEKKQDKSLDTVSSQILHQLHGKSESEKQAILRMVKLVFSIKDMK
jgi:transcriptional regulator with XRE-family HTH domain